MVHASRGKVTRAEPIAALYEQWRVRHVGSLPALEDECCTWVQGASDSPDRMDALVWGLTELMLGAAPFTGRGEFFAAPPQPSRSAAMRPGQTFGAGL